MKTNTIGKWRSFFAMASHFTPYVRKQASRLGFSFLMGLGYIFMGMLEPWPMKMIFDYVLLERKPPPFLRQFTGDSASRLLLLNYLVGAIILIAVVRGVFYYYQRLQTARAGQQVVAKIRVDLFAHLQRLSLRFHHRRRIGDLLTHLTGDIKNLREMLISLPIICTQEALLMVGMAVVMACVDWQLTMVALAVVPMLFWLLNKYQRQIKQEMKSQREEEGDLSSMASEVFGAIKVVQSFHREQLESNRFLTQDRKCLHSGLRLARLFANLRWGSDLAVAATTALILGLAGQRVLSGALTPGDILVFTFYLRAFNKPFKRISRISEKVTKGTVSGDRIWGLLDIEPDIKECKGASSADRFRGNIRFDCVHFGYRPDSPVLCGVNLTVEAGERLAVIGPTGSGKSTLVSLIPRFFDPTAGQVLIDGADIRSYTLSSLRKQIGFVFQDPVLFSVSVAENIAYGKLDATFEEIQQAAEAAGIHSIIESLPEGYHTILGERGGTLSGGQRQCVAIARAMIRDAPIVILDEPTSGLDLASTELVTDALKRLLEGRTVILITHQEEPKVLVDRTVSLASGTIACEQKLQGCNL